VTGTGKDHAFIIVTGQNGNSTTIEGEPTNRNPFNFGPLIGVETPGSNGLKNSDDPTKTTVTSLGTADVNCNLVASLLSLGLTANFNTASGAPKGGWKYTPDPDVTKSAGGQKFNSNSYASFLLHQLRLLGLFNITFGAMNLLPGWGLLYQ
jgi:hypothetical protein